MSRIISRFVERALPFFKKLKKAGLVKWTPKAEATLQDLKIYLSSAPTLVTPKAPEPLLLYLVTMNQVVSVALVAGREVRDEETTAAKPSHDVAGAEKMLCLLVSSGLKQNLRFLPSRLALPRSKKCL